MSAREAAIVALAAIWEDGGEDFLYRAGLATDWSEALAPLPDVLFDAGDAPFGIDDAMLGRLREVYAQAELGGPALAFAETAWNLRVDRLGARHPDTLVAQGRFGNLLHVFGDHELAGTHLEAAARGLKDTLNRPDVRQAVAYADLARFLRDQGEDDRAMFFMELALRIRRIATPQRLGATAAQLAEMKIEAGKDEEGAALLQDAWEMLVRERGENDPFTLDRARSLGPLWLRLEEPERAVAPLRSLWRAVQGSDDEDDAMRVAFDLGRALGATGQDEEGFRLVERSVQWAREVEDEDGLPHPDLAARLVVWSRLLEERGNPEEAEGFLIESVEADRAIHGEESAEVGLRQAAVGDFLHRRGRREEALGWMDAGLSLVRSSVGDDHDLTRVVAERLVDYLLAATDEAVGDPGLARVYLEQARKLTFEILGPDHPHHRAVKYHRPLGS